MKVKDNVYTTLTLEELGKFKAAVESSLTKRNNAYNVELERQIANDNLCKKFASVAGE